MRALLLILAAACGMLACKKSDNIGPALTGKWELRRSHGGFGGYDSTYLAGNGTFYQFNNDSSYQYTFKGKLSTQGVFHYKSKSFSAGGSVYLDEIFFDNTQYGDAIVISGNKMSIGTTQSDGIENDYVKIGN